MKSLSCIVLAFLLSVNFFEADCHHNIRFSSSKGSGPTSKGVISENLEGINSISEELIANERTEGEEEEEDEEEGKPRTDFDSMAHRSLENAEKEAVVGLEDVETEDLLRNEIFRTVLERLKKLWYIGQCRRDYTHMCPLGWSQSSYDHSLCVPPKSYEGPCRSMDFAKTTPEDKELFAWKCETEWPCVRSYPLKVMSRCPTHWNPVGDKLCIAPQGYSGICPTALDFSKFTFEMRTRMAQECNFEWPADIDAGTRTPQAKKYRPTEGGPVEESGDVIKIVHAPV